MKKRFTALLVVTGTTAACMPMGYRGSTGDWGPMMYYGHGGFFMGVLFLILIAVVIYILVRISKPGPQSPLPSLPPETPLDILKKRYAKGEITREEFEKMKKDLEE
jgi:putative membrane protein